MKRITSLLAAALLASACAGPRGPAPVDDRRPAPAPVSKPPVAQATPVPGAPAPRRLYTVKRGDTLYSIALEHGVDYRELAQANRLEDPGKIRVGQTLRIPPPEEKPAVQVGAARGAGAVESRPLEPGTAAVRGDGSLKTAPKALRLPYSEQNLALLQKDQAAKPAPQPVSLSPKPAAEKDPEAIEFTWPVRGKVIGTFSEPRNKGLDIAGKIGDPVVAAAQGRVIYVGSGIQGLGKFVVIKHDNGFNTVYAHNREIVVKMDQNVARGQKIAELGDSDSDVPKLHFEIRKLGKPLDPLRYLPPS